jgi:hypothetical protein
MKQVFGYLGRSMRVEQSCPKLRGEKLCLCVKVPFAREQDLDVA